MYRNMGIKRGDTVQVIVAWQVGGPSGSTPGKQGVVIRVSRDKTKVDVNFGEYVSGAFAVEKVWRIPVKDLKVLKEDREMAIALTRAVLRNVLRYITSTGRKGIQWDTPSWVSAKKALHMSNIELAEAVRALLEKDATGTDTGVKVIQPKGKGSAFIAAKLA